MRSHYASIPIIAGLLLLGCDTTGEDEFVGVIVNETAYTLDVDDPLDETKYFHLKPGEETRRIDLQEGRYTFRAFYASDSTPYESISIRINAIEADAVIRGAVYDWAVIFVEPYFFGRVEYYP